MSTPPEEVLQQRHDEWNEPRRFEFDMPDEPAELVAQSAAMQAQREHLAQKCADCGEQRSAHGWGSSTLRGTHAFIEQCPNADDPVLCKVQDDGVFVPECGCPVHDPDEAAR